MSWKDFLERLGTPVVDAPLGRLPLGVEDYDPATVDNSLALVLHPTLSSAAVALRRRAADIFQGNILASTNFDILPALETLFLTN